MNIPDEAVEAAAQAWEEACEQGKAGPGYRDAWSAAIEAAAPLLMARAWDEGNYAGADRSENHANPYRP